VHILTKILIVVVTLLVVMLVPLVMVNASNEGSYKARFERQQSMTAAANQALEAAQASQAASEASMLAEIKALQTEASSVASQLRSASAENQRLQGELSRTTASVAGVEAKLERLAAIGEASQELTNKLVQDAKQLRESEARLNAKLVQLEQQVADLRDSEEVLQAANASLQEQLKGVERERDRAQSTIARYEASGGPLNLVAAGEVRRVADRNLRAVVSNVVQDAGDTLATIDAGQLDGVQVGWVLTISDGPDYVANLRVLDVDVNRSVGIVELQDPSRGLVAVGHVATARQGE
jgi:peptidoglycan hydrolase CwlO-like protein